MLDKKYVENLLNDKIKIIDLVYETTSLKLGPLETRMALKYILLDDKTEINVENELVDKYNFVSGQNGGRELLKQVSKLDVYMILHTFVVAYGEISNVSLSLTEEEYSIIKKDKNIILNEVEIVNVMLYANVVGLEELYLFLVTHNKLAIALFDLFIDKRYKEGLKDKLDSIDLQYIKDFYNTM